MTEVKIPKGEAALIALFKLECAGNQADDRIPLDLSHDTVVYEMPLKSGRADIVVFHALGSISVIEAKDGSRGLSEVVKGIGQVSFYAAQLAISKVNFPIVRRCLMWSSTGSIEEDLLIEMACEQAGVIAMPQAHLRKFDGVLARVFGVDDGGR